jgi:hypothetical protein
VEQPYFNEPGYEAEMTTPYGKQQSSDYNEVIRIGTIRWAMTEQLKHPSPGFEEVIKTHFKIKRAVVVKQVKTWLKEAQTSKTAGFYQKLKKAVEELKTELQSLDPEPLENFEEEQKEEKKEDKGKEKEEAKKKEKEKEKEESKEKGKKKAKKKSHVSQEY